MSESRFDRSLLPPALDFYRGELGEVNRPDRRGWAMVVGGCPFHPSKSRKSFFVHIDGGFYCFSSDCRARGGNVLDFVRKRYNLDFKTAARRLGAWIDATTPDQQKEFRRLEEERRRQQTEEAERLETERRERIAIRQEIHADTKLLNELSERLRETPDDESLWHCLELAHESRPISEQEYLRLAGLEDSDGF